jgi:uncharacterized repeat protein (TIGR03803 family)
VVSVTTAGVEKLLFSFTGNATGAAPRAALINSGGTIYGKTSGGGRGDSGTVFSVTPDGVETVVYSFTQTDGYAPYADVINVGGKLYGTTVDGGGSPNYAVFGCETVFAVGQ